MYKIKFKCFAFTATKASIYFFTLSDNALAFKNCALSVSIENEIYFLENFLFNSSIVSLQIFN